MVILLKDTLVNREIIICCINALLRALRWKMRPPRVWVLQRQQRTELLRVSERALSDDRREERETGRGRQDGNQTDCLTGG